MKFLISPGLPRSGTTYMYHQLAVGNGELFNSPLHKETNMLWSDRSLNDLVSDFYGVASPEKTTIDFSPSYLAGPMQPVDRIVELAQSHQVKVLIHLRHPVEQAFAAYLHDLAAHVSRLENRNSVDYSFWGGESQKKYLVKRAPLVRKLIEGVGRENIAVVNFHRDLSNAAQLTSFIAAFLGAELQPFSSAKIGAGGWLPNFCWSGDHRSEFAFGEVVRTLPPHHLLLVNGEFSYLWKHVDDRFAMMLLQGQSTWTRNLDERQTSALWRDYFEEDFLEILSALGEDKSDYPDPLQLEASSPFLDEKVLPDSGEFLETALSTYLTASPIAQANKDKSQPRGVDRKPTQYDVVAAYHEFLGRDPESSVIVDKAIENNRSVSELRRTIYGSAECKLRFPDRVKFAGREVPRSWLKTAGVESSRSFEVRLDGGFFERFLSGETIIDVGYKGYKQFSRPILPHAIGVDKDFPGYSGFKLPFGDETVDAVYSSHVLEHIANYISAIQDWHRVLKIGGFIVCMVPHKFLYEKRERPPSAYNRDHCRFYTPASLMAEFEDALPPNSYRLRHLADNDEGFKYEIGPDQHSNGAYEIELVIEKIRQPRWVLASSL